MKDLVKAFIHCYKDMGSCRNCPYENDRDKCQQLFNNIELVCNKVAEYVDLEDIRNIVKIIVDRGENNNENKN